MNKLIKLACIAFAICSVAKAQPWYPHTTKLTGRDANAEVFDYERDNNVGSDGVIMFDWTQKIEITKPFSDFYNSLFPGSGSDYVKGDGATAAFPGNASNSVDGFMSASDKAKLDALPVIHRTSVTTNSSGAATWTFPSSFGSTPRVVATAVDNSGDVMVYVKITSKSTSSVTIQVSKIDPVLGVLTLLTGTSVGATNVDIVAVSQ